MSCFQVPSHITVIIIKMLQDEVLVRNSATFRNSSARSPQTPIGTETSKCDAASSVFPPDFQIILMRNLFTQIESHTTST